MTVGTNKTFIIILFFGGEIGLKIKTVCNKVGVKKVYGNSS